MVMKKFLTIAVACVALVQPALARKPMAHVWPELGVETAIVFPNHGAIRNFEADGNDGIWLEDRQRRWYYAELLGGCQGLNFAQAIGFDTRGFSRFDKFSTIIVRDEVCPVASLVTSEKPLSRKQRMKMRKAAIAAGEQVVAPSN